ncbi:MAG TPA: penicillin-binding protein 1B [Desulfurivibrio alkaliphilus]|uniref:Penicillin-binding protein 1B n=1 Tax=Desulfurivibrio alkaliphilus TaxID=427923 RepID=A0A7C2TMU3_9BACT|nr:penicillin-binding protein 1B [Desulfurivibrio alkaliphilus]
MAPRKRTPFRKTRRPRRSSGIFSWRKLLATTALATFLLAALYTLYLDSQVRALFEGKRWEIPARVYARPLELYTGLPLTATRLTRELDLAGYRLDRQLSSAGSYYHQADDTTLHLVTRAFDFGDSQEPSHRLTIRFANHRVAAMEADDGTPLSLVRLDPAQIGSFHPLHHEDRLLVARQEIPQALVHALLAIEDRRYYRHYGIDPRGIIRALAANIRAGSTVQGGSTLTQQLIKNMYLTHERTLGRKVNEAIMALLLEYHYNKEEILTAYVNEVFLGQDGQRAIHGFGLASQFYFRRQLNELDLPQLALLVGLVRGPSYYDPRRFPQRSVQRRDQVLQAMATAGFLTPAEAASAQAAPLEQNLHATGGATPFPAFVGLVRRQLRESYREQDLTGQGLKIFTTLDPQVQWQVEETINTAVAKLERQTDQQRIQAAVVVSRYDSGEIEALAGSRITGEAGFNRAVDARRPIGSLIKPAVYLSALEQGYTLATLLEDAKITVDIGGGKQWQPRNFDQREHGLVPLYEALANSYNLATVRLGMDVGLDRVIDTLTRLGLQQQPPPYPSLLLGALSISPLEVSQLYQTLAAGGFYSPQRVIQRVIAADNRPLERFPITVEQRLEPEHAFLINTALQKVVSDGTGRPLSRYLPGSLAVAGKTGSSDGLRDSWFAGFTGDRLVVVWLGLDDNQPLGLTGSTGALPVWGELMRALDSTPLVLAKPSTVEWVWFNPQRQSRTRARAPGAVQLPFLNGSIPATPEEAPLAREKGDGGGWLGRIVDRVFQKEKEEKR